MFTDKTLISRIQETLAGAFIFFVVVTGTTYYLQSSLIIFKHYDAYTHWATVLIVTPLVAGIILRQAKLIYPLISTVLGALGSAALLYQLYKVLWAEPPTITDLTIYFTVVLGIGYIATQPLRTTFMIAFRIGRFSVPTFKKRSQSTNKKKTQVRTPVRKTYMSKTQRLQSYKYGSIIAMVELLIGTTSLVLSIFSIFFLGRS